MGNKDEAMGAGKEKKNCGSETGPSDTCGDVRAAREDLECSFCKECDQNDLLFGKFYKIGRINCHHFCLLLSSKLLQNGHDNEGFLGFLYEDILKEIKRVSKMRCYYCGWCSATLVCDFPSCKKAFHLPCGRRNGALNMFSDRFQSYCKEHRPMQKVPLSIFNQRNDRSVDMLIIPLVRVDQQLHTENNDCKVITKWHPPADENFLPSYNSSGAYTCAICYDDVVPYPTSQSIWPECCRKDSWLHRICVGKLALSAGKYHVRCPLCNNQPIFLDVLYQYGFYVPDQDASWELEKGAFQELLQRPQNCFREDCLCPKGNAFSTTKNGPWKLLPCGLCGSQAVHRACDDTNGRKGVVCDRCCPSPCHQNNMQLNNSDVTEIMDEVSMLASDTESVEERQTFKVKAILPTLEIGLNLSFNCSVIQDDLKPVHSRLEKDVYSAEFAKHKLEIISAMSNALKHNVVCESGPSSSSELSFSTEDTSLSDFNLSDKKGAIDFSMRDIGNSTTTQSLITRLSNTLQLVKEEKQRQYKYPSSNKHDTLKAINRLSSEKRLIIGEDKHGDNKNIEDNYGMKGGRRKLRKHLNEVGKHYEDNKCLSLKLDTRVDEKLKNSSKQISSKSSKPAIKSGNNLKSGKDIEQKLDGDQSVKKKKKYKIKKSHASWSISKPRDGINVILKNGKFCILYKGQRVKCTSVKEFIGKEQTNVGQLPDGREVLKDELKKKPVKSRKKSIYGDHKTSQVTPPGSPVSHVMTLSKQASKKKLLPEKGQRDITSFFKKMRTEYQGINNSEELPSGNKGVRATTPQKCEDSNKTDDKIFSTKGNKQTSKRKRNVGTIIGSKNTKKAIGKDSISNVLIDGTFEVNLVTKKIKMDQSDKNKAKMSKKYKNLWKYGMISSMSGKVKKKNNKNNKKVLASIADSCDNKNKYQHSQKKNPRMSMRQHRNRESGSVVEEALTPDILPVGSEESVSTNQSIPGRCSSLNDNCKTSVLDLFKYEEGSDMDDHNFVPVKTEEKHRNTNKKSKRVDTLQLSKENLTGVNATLIKFDSTGKSYDSTQPNGGVKCNRKRKYSDKAQYSKPSKRFGVLFDRTEMANNQLQSTTKTAALS